MTPAFDPCAPCAGNSPKTDPVKGSPLTVIQSASAACVSDFQIDCSRFNAVHVDVVAAGVSPSATLTVEGSYAQYGVYLPLPDGQATQAIAASTSFDVLVGPLWVQARLSGVVSGTFTVTITPFQSPGQSRLSATIVCQNLAAINANIGACHIDDVLDIGLNGGIYQGTGSFATPETGLKIWRDGGIGRIAGYSSPTPGTPGTVQWYVGTDGKLYFGGGAGWLDNVGISLAGGSASSNMIKFYSPLSGGVLNGYLYSNEDIGSTWATLQVDSTAIAKSASVAIIAAAPVAARVGTIRLQVRGGSPFLSNEFRLQASGTDVYAALDNSRLEMTSGYSVGLGTTGARWEFNSGELHGHAADWLIDTGKFVGIGSAAERITFAHATPTGTVSILGAHFLVGPTAPGAYLRTTIEHNGTGNLRLQGATTNSRYRSDLSINSNAGLGINAYDDTAGVYLPIAMNTTGLTVSQAFGCNGRPAQAAYASGGAAPVGGTGTAAGAWDTAAHRDAAILLLNNIRLALVANGIMS